MDKQQDRKQCAVCHAYLFDDDDIVYCPECGAPHHRDCYNAVGHCGCAEAHGTPQQYNLVHSAENETAKIKEKIASDKERLTPGTVRCRFCGEEYDDGIPACPRCGAPRVIQGFGNDMLGGVPADTDIGEGVTAEEAKRFVFANTPRYIPRFAMMAAGKKTSWNWLAFLFPWAWFASRKMYLYAVITGIIGAASVLLTQPLYSALAAAGISTQQMTNAALLAAADIKLPAAALALAAVGLIINLTLRILCGIFGDGIYRRHVIADVKKINAESQDADEDYRRMGGVSLWALIIALLAAQYLPIILISFVL